MASKQFFLIVHCISIHTCMHTYTHTFMQSDVFVCSCLTKYITIQMLRCMYILYICGYSIAGENGSLFIEERSKSKS